jgi:hypothetical protein
MGGSNSHRLQPGPRHEATEGEFIVETEPINPFAARGVRRKFHLTQVHAIPWEAGVKLDNPEFQGCLQPKEFHDWMVTVEEVLDFKGVPNDWRVSLVENAFRERFAAWWKQLKQTKKTNPKAY